jgi:signal transduction histidine kinase/DNA-binding response OmpR family regulator
MLRFLLQCSFLLLLFGQMCAAQQASPYTVSLADTNIYGTLGIHRIKGWKFFPAGSDKGIPVRLNNMDSVRALPEWTGYGRFRNTFFVDSAFASRIWTASYLSPGGMRLTLNGLPLLASGNPSPDPENEVLGRFLVATQQSFIFKQGLNTFDLEFSEHTLNRQWAENQPNIPMRIIDLYLLKRGASLLHRMRAFIFGGTLMLLLTLVLMHGFLAVKFRNDYHIWVALSTFFMLLHAFTLLSNTLIEWTWSFGGFYEWVYADAFLFVVYFYLIAIRKYYQLPMHWKWLNSIVAVFFVLNTYAIHTERTLLDIFHPVAAISTLLYGIWSLFEARKAKPGVPTGIIAGGLLVTVGGAILYVTVVIAFRVSGDFLFLMATLMAYTGLPISLTLNIATGYARLINTLEEKVRERTSQLEASKQELERADEYKSRFFANISHEFRTPLTIARGLIDRISQRTAIDEPLQTDLIPVKRNLKRLGDMVNQIVDLTKHDHDQLALHCKNYRADALVTIDVESFRSLAEYRSQTLVFTSAAPDAILWVDRAKMDIMVNNLISNAIKYTPEGGRIEVSSTVIDRVFALSVQDNGKGIPPSEHEAIFQRFHRLKQETGDYVEGMGIGLELSRTLARLHGGDIHIDAAYTGGARFVLTLPLSTSADPVQTDETFTPAPAAVSEPAVSASRRRNILLVEDNDDMAAYVSSILGETGAVERARNGEEALQKLAANTPDLVITDLMMPVMDGVALVRAMHQDAGLRNIPVVVLTARAIEKDRIDLLRIGVVDYITKPFLVDELMLKARNLLTFAEHRKKAEIVLTAAERTLTEETRFAEKAAVFITSRLSDASLSIDAVADHFDISRRTFYRIIEAETGMSGAEFIRELRLQQARILLQDNPQEWTPDKLAAEVGLGSGRTLKKHYTQRFGQLPEL